MKMNLIENGKTEILFTKENCTDISPYLKEYGQIKIVKGLENWIGKYIYHVVKTEENEVDIFLEIIDTEAKVN